jgi:catechol 2,3-dioxygenase-like lactoylglutathione lyase family enzyme
MPVTTVRTKGLEHWGYTVSDAERTARFYEDVFGAKREWAIEMEGDEVAEMVRVPGADVRVVLLSFGNAAIELFEYRNEGGRGHDRRADDIGAGHLCLEVEDVDAAYARLQELSVPCRFPPVHVDEGPLAGLSFFYFDDPDGLPVELLARRGSADEA